MSIMPAFYLERPDKAKTKREKIMAVSVFLTVVVVIYLAVTDYTSMPDPNASTCKMGFEKTGCAEGYDCKGAIIPCIETNASFKYSFTDWMFDKPACRAEKVYRETCVLK